MATPSFAMCRRAAGLPRLFREFDPQLRLLVTYDPQRRCDVPDAGWVNAHIVGDAANGGQRIAANSLIRQHQRPCIAVGEICLPERFTAKNFFVKPKRSVRRKLEGCWRLRGVRACPQSAVMRAMPAHSLLELVFSRQPDARGA